MGLKFQIDGQTHYGWARASVSYSYGTARIYGYVTGYAYETIVNKPIFAGQIKDDDDGAADAPASPKSADEKPISRLLDPNSLGVLALGAAANPTAR